MSDFPEFPKIPRLHREVTITEKIDGTNGLISIEQMSDICTPLESDPVLETPHRAYVSPGDGHVYSLRAGSRKRWLTREQDNFGFAKFVYDNAIELVSGLGVGNHYGEWWGSKIARGYGLPRGERRFSLFNTSRWTEDNTPDCVSVVPILDAGNAALLNELTHSALAVLRRFGSVAAPGYQNPEGIIVYHAAANSCFKVTLKNDDAPKGNVA